MSLTPTHITKKIILDLLKSNPNKTFTTAQIKDEVKKNSDGDISPGVVSGSLHSLSNDNKSGVTNPSRGYYSYNPDLDEQNSDLTSKIYLGVKTAVDHLLDVKDSIDPFDLDEQDLSVLKDMKKIITDLENFNKKLESTYGNKVNS